MVDAEVVKLAEEIDEYGWKTMMDEIQKSGGVQLQSLKMAAQRYLFIINDLNQELQRFKQLLKRQKEIRRSNDAYKELEEYQLNKEKVTLFLTGKVPKTLYEISFDFQKLLNEFLGQKVKMVFVYDNGSGPELYEILTEEVLKFDYSKNNTLTARYRANVTEMSSAMKKIKSDQELKFNLPNLKEAYQQAMYRYDQSRQKGRRSVYWNTGNKWTAMTVSAAGDINEAYAMFVLLNKVPPYFNGDLESNIGEFMQSGVAQVDNISGLLQGDVTSGNIEYGIKSADASALGLTQIKKIAEQIVKDDFSKESLEKIKAQHKAKGRTRNKLIETVDKAYADIISEIQKSLDK